MKVTYNQIVKQLKTFFEAHYQVNSFKNGDIWNAVQNNELDDALYPLVYATDNGASSSEGSTSISFELFCMDITDKSGNISNEIKSDTFQILNDAVAYLDKLITGDFYYLKISKNTTLSSFTEYTDDWLTGWKMTVTLTQPNTYNECAIPYSGAGVPIGGGCLGVTIFDADGNLISEVDSGDTYNVSSSNVSNSDNSYNVNVLATASLSLPNIVFTDSDGTTTSVPSVTDIVATLCPTFEDATVHNSNDSYSVTVGSGGDLELPNINFTDSDGTTTSIPSMEAVVCTPSVNSTELFWELYFELIDEKNIIECTNYNVGIFSTGSGSNYGSIEVSTDDITYIPLTYPFAPIVGNTYYFKRTTFLATGGYSIEGENANSIIDWELVFESTDKFIKIDVDANNVGVFTRSNGSNYGSIEVSTDDITYTALTIPFSPIIGTTYYFKRTTFAITGFFNLNGYV